MAILIDEFRHEEVQYRMNSMQKLTVIGNHDSDNTVCNYGHGEGPKERERERERDSLVADAKFV